MSPPKASSICVIERHTGNWISAKRYQTSGFLNRLRIVTLVMTFDFLLQGVWRSCVIHTCQVLLRWQISWSVHHGLQPHSHVSPMVWTTQRAVELVACPTFVRNSALATSLSSTSAILSMHIWLVRSSWYCLQSNMIKLDVNFYKLCLHFLDKIYASINLSNNFSTYKMS
jgi:hypothetical protein